MSLTACSDGGGVALEEDQLHPADLAERVDRSACTS
jgi:hypothetical protein